MTWPCIGPNPPIWNISQDMTSVRFFTFCGTVLTGYVGGWRSAAVQQYQGVKLRILGVIQCLSLTWSTAAALQS